MHNLHGHMEFLNEEKESHTFISSARISKAKLKPVILNRTVWGSERCTMYEQVHTLVQYTKYITLCFNSYRLIYQGTNGWNIENVRSRCFVPLSFIFRFNTIRSPYLLWCSLRMLWCYAVMPYIIQCFNFFEIRFFFPLLLLLLLYFIASSLFFSLKTLRRQANEFPVNGKRDSKCGREKYFESHRMIEMRSFTF